MDRREFLKRAGVGSAAVAGLPALETMLATPALAVDSKVGGHGFFFQVLNHSTTTAELLIISGCGQIGRGIQGGGSFTAFLPEGAPPFPIVATGHWSARKLTSFDTIGSYGELVAGTADLQAVAEVTAPFTARAETTLRIVCNIGPAGLVNDPFEEEGVTVSVPDEGLTFVPNTPPTGLTIFTTGFFGG